MQPVAPTFERAGQAKGAVPMVKNYISGALVESSAPDYLPVTNPSLGNEIANVSLSNSQDVDRAVRTAKAAFPAWSAMPIKERAQVFYRYKEIGREHV